MADLPQLPAEPGEPDPAGPAGEPVVEPEAGAELVAIRRDGELHLYFPVEVVIVDGGVPKPEERPIDASIWQALHDALA